MSIQLEVPTDIDRIEIVTDWIELQTLVDPQSEFGYQELQGALTPLIDHLDEASDNIDPNEEDVDQENFDDAPPNIIDDKLEEIRILVINELLIRKRICNGGYPFNLLHFGISVSNDNSMAHACYTFCLLLSFIRSKSKVIQDGIFRECGLPPERIFQYVGTTACRGLINGHAYSFGFPRDDHTNFLRALQNVIDVLREGNTPDPDRYFTQTPNDGGVDVIAWNNSKDELPGKLVLFAQCGSGNDWNNKPKVDVPNFKSLYLTEFPSEPVPAMVIPFALPRQEQHLYDKWLTMTGRYGMIIDRLRLIEYINNLSTFNSDENEYLEYITRWNLNALRKIIESFTVEI